MMGQVAKGFILASIGFEKSGMLQRVSKGILNSQNSY